MTWQDFLTPREQLQLGRLESRFASAEAAYRIKRTIANRCRQRMLRALKAKPLERRMKRKEG